MATNLDVQAQLNQLLADQNKLLEEAGKLAKDQLTVVRDLVTAMRTANFKDVTQEVQSVQQAVQGVAQASQNMGSANQNVFDQMTNALRQAQKEEGKLGADTDDLAKKLKKFAVASSAIDGFVQGLRFTSNMMHGLIGLGTGLVTSLGHIGAAIISIPFKMLTGLITMSDMGGDNSLFEALQSIRKEFGALHDTSGKAIIDMAKNMKGELANTGLSVYRIFGNLAERLKILQEYAHNLGPLFSNLAGEFVKNAEAIGAYYKGLGLTEDGQKAVATRAKALGTAVTEELRQMSNYSIQLSKAFNGQAGSAKEISREMGTLMADFKHFGGVSIKEIGQAVTYFHRLGLEVSKVMGVIDKYDNFQDAAEGAAHLSQAFGLNVDALQMMKAQNPAERVEMLRKAFFQAGRSVEGMTRQERTLLAQQTGLDDSALDLVFSMKNQGLSYDQVTKKAGMAQKKQLSQAEAMTKLADAIERMSHSGSMGKGGFIDRFIQGFTVGIQRSKEFRQIMVNLRQDLRTAYYEGIKTGKAFVDLFPGVKDVFKGISDMFEPGRFRAMFRKITQTFKDFFGDLTKNPTTALPRLLDHLKDDFFSWFQPNQEKGRRILDGFKKFFTAIADIAGGMLRKAMEGLTTGVRLITDLIAGRRSLGTPDMGGGLGFLQRLIQPIWGAIKDLGPSLWGALKEMFSAVWTKVSPWLQNNWLKILSVMFSPSLLGMFGRSITTSLSVNLIGSLAKSLGGLLSHGPGLIGTVLSKLGGAAGRAGEAAGRAGAGIGGAGNMAKGAIRAASQTAQAADRSRVGPGTMARLAIITTVIGVGMVGLIYGIVQTAKAIKENNLSIANVAGASLVMIAAATAMAGMAGSLALLNIATKSLGPGSTVRLLAGVAIIGAVAYGMAMEGKAIVKSLSELKIDELKRAGLSMAAISGFFVAAAAVTGIAALLGATVLGTLGTGALAITAGLAAISATVVVMSREGLTIMRAINSFKVGPDFEMKTKAFASVMTAVGSFAANMSEIIAATRPSFESFLSGTFQEDMQANLRSVGKVISDMTGGIVAIVTAVQRTISKMAGSEAQLKAAESLGSVLSAVSGLAQAISPPMEQLQEPSFFQRLAGAAGSTSQNVQSFADSFRAVSDSLMSVVREIEGSMHRLSGYNHTDNDRKTIALLPDLLSGVASLAKALMPPPAVASELAKGKDAGTVARAVSQTVEGLLSALTGSHIITSMASLMTRFMNDIETAQFSPRTLDVLKVALPALGDMFGAVGSIAQTVSSLVSATTGAHADPGAISDAGHFVTVLMANLGAYIPQILSSMSTAFRGLSPDAAKGLDAGAKAFTSVISSITTMVSGDIPTGADIDAKFQQLNQVLVSAHMGIGSIATRLAGSTLGASVQNLVSQIQHSRIGGIAHVVHDMVTQVNALSTALNGIEPINIELGLQRLGDSLGLGAAGDYTIRNRNFNINVGVTVKLDNNGLDAIELAMLRRNGPHPTRINHGDIST